MNKLKKWFERESREMEMLLASVPVTVVVLFVVSVICMNLLANKTLLQLEWIALDGGILISWLSFMCMNIITKHFGPKASNTLSVFAAAINLLVCAVFYIASIIPSDAGDFTGFDRIFGGTWFILLGSTVAFILSALINNMINRKIGRMLASHPDDKFVYRVQTFVPTFTGQFRDNFIFSVIVFVFFAPVFWDGFHWTVLQCFTCALTGAVAELIMEVIFSPWGYRVVTRWKKNNVGREYLEHISR